jgi:polysaccharide pyruvyl transferase WcaK-like protein
MEKSPRRIGLVHHMDGGNLGDDATVTGIMGNIKARWPDAHILGLAMVYQDSPRPLVSPFSHRNQDSEVTTFRPQSSLKAKAKSLVINTPWALKALKAFHTVVTAPEAILRELIFLVKAFRSLRSLDLLVISPGGQLAESSGRHRFFRYRQWLYPYTIFKWAALAKLSHTKAIVLNLATGQLRGVSQGLVHGALSLADSVYFRDKKSREHIRLKNLDGRSLIFPDSAYSREVTAPPQEANKPAIVGFAPIVFGDPSPAHDNYLAKLGSFASWLIQNQYRVRLFCTNIGVDSPALCGVEHIVRADIGANRSLDRVHQWSTEELFTNMSSMDYVVTSRFHGVLFAHLLNKPVLVVSDHEPVKALMNDLGLAEYCLDIEECDSNMLSEKFISLVKNRDEIKGRMADNLAFAQQELVKQFDEMFPEEGLRKIANVVSLLGSLPH